MAQNARCENELGKVSDKCRSTISDEDNVSDFIPISKNVRKSSGRRSFSNRRSLCFDSLGVIGGSTDNKNAEYQLGAPKNGAATTSAEECIQKLKSEKEAWQRMLEERKKTYKAIKEHSNSEALKLDLDNCVDVLWDEDTKFLNNQPHYENIVARINHVCEVASICMHMKHKSAHMSAKVAAAAEQQGAAVTKKILKHAESYYV